MPDFLIERRAGGRVAGVDEVGRGALAGPVVAAAVIFRRPPPAALARLIDDSKALSVARRQAAYDALTAHEAVEITLGAASVGEIARINILQATLLAMHRAVARLAVPPDLALIDGNQPPPLACKLRCVPGGDATSLSIAAASIVAKVVRDRLMARLSVRFPHYGWERNAGYGTESHRAALARHGACHHHRAGFGSVPDDAAGAAD